MSGMSGTSIPAARAALFARLDAAAGLASVQRTYGPPDVPGQEAEVVALLGTRDPDEEPATLGPGRKDENYIIDIGIKVHGRDKTAGEVDVRAYELADVVADAIEGSGDLTLDNTVMWALVSGITSMAPTPDGPAAAEGGGWILVLRVSVTCRARIDRR